MNRAHTGRHVRAGRSKRKNPGWRRKREPGGKESGPLSKEFTRERNAGDPTTHARRTLKRREGDRGTSRRKEEKLKIFGNGSAQPRGGLSYAKSVSSSKSKKGE